MLTKQSKLPGKQLMPKGGITKPDIIDLQALRTTEAMAACDLQRSSSPTSHLEQDHHQHKIRSCLVTQSQTSKTLTISNDGDVASFEGIPFPWRISLLFPISHLILATRWSHTFPGVYSKSQACWWWKRYHPTPEHAFQFCFHCGNWIEWTLMSTATGLNIILQNLVAPSSSELPFSVPLSLLAAPGFTYCSKKAMQCNL